MPRSRPSFAGSTIVAMAAFASSEAAFGGDAALVPYSGCGQIWQIIECGIGVYAQDGQVFFVENLEGFSEGDWVYLDGQIDTECKVDFIWCFGIQCLVDNTATACPTTSLCGTLAGSPFCGIILAAEDGSQWLLDAPEGLGDFTFGDGVLVEGVPIQSCITVPECSVGACLSVVSIAPCTPSIGDLDGNGSVDGADIGLLLGQWGTCPPLTVGCLGDVNFDSLVDSADLGLVLANWS